MEMQIPGGSYVNQNESETQMQIPASMFLNESSPVAVVLDPLVFAGAM